MSDSRKQAILSALDKFVRQRAGLDFGNYGDVKSYRSEQRSITRDLHDYRQLRNAVEWRGSITADMLIEASRSAFSGRLTLNDISARYDDGSIYWVFSVDYCTGQYFPTEYRKAACAVLASVLWQYTREHMPAPTTWRVESWGQWNGNTFEHERSAPMQIHAACELLETKGGQPYGHVQALHDGKSAGDWLRSYFRKEFGRGIASRWFN